MKLQKLFKKTSHGADQEWSIEVKGSTIITRFGQVGGKIQETQDTIREGKNIGKANETSPEEQAEAEAQSQWEKKLKKSYVTNIEDAREGKVDSIIEGGVSPMLAQRFDEHGDKIVYPAFAQPKFDGHRCIATVKDRKATLWSRTRKPITGLPHIIKDLENFVKFNGLGSTIFDGELYHHEYRNRFEELTSFIRNPEPKKGHEIVQYHIYDEVNEKPQEERFIAFFHMFQKYTPSLIPVDTIKVENEDELMGAFENYIKQGYEGCIVRNVSGLYVHKRSYDVQKIKEFVDAEFKIVDIEEGRGKLTGHAIFICEMPDTKVQFKVKMRGALDELKTYFDNPELVIGKYLTVKFQGYTNKNGVPRFPVGWRFAEKL